jgi:hypothetical protein
LIGWRGFPRSSSSVAIPDVLERLRLPPRLARALLALQGKLTHSGYASACPLRAGERSEIAPVLGLRKHASEREGREREKQETQKRIREEPIPGKPKTRLRNTIQRDRLFTPLETAPFE